MIFISNQVFDAHTASDVSYEALVHNARGDQPIEAHFQLGAGATLATDLRELIPGIEGVLGGEAGCVLIKADKHTLSVVHYIMLKGNDSLAVDHAF